MPSKIQSRLLAAGGLLLMGKASALAQCAMCRATLAGDPHAAAASHQMNMAVLLLLIPAIVLFCGFFLVMYRYRNSFRSSSPDSGFGSAGSLGDDGFDPSDLPAWWGSAGPQCY